MMIASDGRGCVPGFGLLGMYRIYGMGLLIWDLDLRRRLAVGFCRRFVERLLMTRFRDVISPTARGFALGFLLSFSMD